ncbi:hypothetical protein [Thalassotalea fusca]
MAKNRYFIQRFRAQSKGDCDWCRQPINNQALLCHNCGKYTNIALATLQQFIGVIAPFILLFLSIGALVISGVQLRHADDIQQATNDIRIDAENARTDALEAKAGAEKAQIQIQETVEQYNNIVYEQQGLELSIERSRLNLGYSATIPQIVNLTALIGRQPLFLNLFDILSFEASSLGFRSNAITAVLELPKDDEQDTKVNKNTIYFLETLKDLNHKKYEIKNYFSSLTTLQHDICEHIVAKEVFDDAELTRCSKIFVGFAFYQFLTELHYSRFSEYINQPKIDSVFEHHKVLEKYVLNQVSEKSWSQEFTKNYYSVLKRLSSSSRDNVFSPLFYNVETVSRAFIDANENFGLPDEYLKALTQVLPVYAFPADMEEYRTLKNIWCSLQKFSEFCNALKLYKEKHKNL